MSEQETSEVESVEILHQVEWQPIWYSVTVDGETYALHANWVAKNGDLRKGDKVTYEKSMVKRAESGKQGVDVEGMPLFNKLERWLNHELA